MKARREHDPAVAEWAYNLMLQALRARMPPGAAPPAQPAAHKPARASRRRVAGSAAPNRAPSTAQPAQPHARAGKDAPQLAQSWPDDGADPHGESS